MSGTMSVVALERAVESLRYRIHTLTPVERMKLKALELNIQCFKELAAVEAKKRPTMIEGSISDHGRNLRNRFGATNSDADVAVICAAPAAREMRRRSAVSLERTRLLFRAVARVKGNTVTSSSVDSWK